MNKVLAPIYILCATKAFGMGMDIPIITTNNTC